MTVFPKTNLALPNGQGERVVREQFGRRMFDETFIYPDGKPAEYFLWGASKVPVHIMAVTTDRQVVVVRQYRHALQELFIEVPGGLPRQEEAAEDTAFRELEEETGYRPGRVIRLADCFISNPTIRHHGIPVLAVDCVKVGDPHPDPTEIIEPLTCPLEDWLTAIMSGEVCDGQSMSLTLLALPHLGLLPTNLLPGRKR